MTRATNALLSTLVLGTLFCTAIRAATYTAASCGESDVAAAVAKAANGDTVQIPSCPSGVSWSTGLTVTTGITLIGQGAGNTVLVDNTSKGDSNCQGATPLILVSPSSNVAVRVSGFTINGVAAQYNCGESASHISISGTTQSFRVDNITFNLGVAGVNTNGGVAGVIDHNTFNDAADVFPVAVHHDSWQGIGAYGDNSWAQPDTMGTAAAVYMEDNTFAFTSGGSFPVGCFDSEEGGRLVFRHNTGCPFVGVHGLDSSGRYRSVRQWEIYNNTFSAQANPNANMYTGVFLRGGTGVIFNNTFNDSGSTPYITLVQVNSYRDTSAYAPWGPSYSAEECDGRGPFDTGAGTVYASGTASSTSTLDTLVASGSPGWTTNQWAPTGTTVYSLVDVTTGWGSTIVSNTSTTVVTSSAAQAQGHAHTWSAGDSYQVLSASSCVDQIGRGAGLLVQDSAPWSGLPVLKVTGQVGPVNQALDPAYAWSNNHNSITQSAIVSNNEHVIKNRDYYDWVSSFSGTSGVGAGLLAARPTTCTPYVGYWATDTSTLYQCSASNTWTAYYQPFTYPHPLVQGAGVAAPTNLQAVSQ